MRYNYFRLIFLICLSFVLLPLAVYAEWSANIPNPVLEYHYTYDHVGNIAQIDDKVKSSNTQSFVYDEINRLTQAQGVYGAQSYSYDSVGNIQGTPEPVKDANGNATNYNNKNITYDYENRPIKIEDTTTGTVTEFVYDYTGQRVKKSVVNGQATATTLYVGNIYEEMTGGNINSKTKYVYAGATRVASIVSQDGQNNIYYYHPDHLGSSNIMTDSVGVVVQYLAYEPWGGVITNNKTPPFTYDTTYKFTGQPLDDSTGLYYYGARYYDPSLKIFITPDIIVQNLYDPQSLNRYTYCRNNPIILVDPTGYSWLSERWRGSGASEWWNKNRYYVWTGALILSTWGSGYLTTGFAHNFFTAALKSEMFSVVSNLSSGKTTNGDAGKSMLLGTIKAGVEGGLKGAIQTEAFKFIDANISDSLENAGAKGTVGGLMSELTGGRFETGFIYTAIPAYAKNYYSKTVGYGPDLHPGKNIPGGKYEYNDIANTKDLNVIGANKELTGHFWEDFWTQGGFVSKSLNYVPGMNALAHLHDVWAGPGENRSYWSMIPAGIVSYSALIAGSE